VLAVTFQAKCGIGVLGVREAGRHCPDTVCFNDTNVALGRSADFLATISIEDRIVTTTLYQA
jgi:hypothetical protein